jgi:hypothetical protein
MPIMTWVLAVLGEHVVIVWRRACTRQWRRAVAACSSRITTNYITIDHEQKSIGVVSAQTMASEGIDDLGRYPIRTFELFDVFDRIKVKMKERTNQLYRMISLYQ